MKVLTAPYILFVLFWKVVPESIRWLRVSSKIEEAELILRKVAKTNKIPFPNSKILPPEKNVKSGSLADLFRPKSMLISTFLQNSIWFITAMVYFGISLASGDLSGDMYRDFVLTSLVEIPGNILAIWLCNRYGRKKSTAFPLVITGLALIGVGFIPSDSSDVVSKWSRVSLGMIGKLSITISFGSVFVLSAELYPTVVRSQALGLLSVISRLGAATSPWIAKGLRSMHGSLPFYTMGALSIVAALQCLPLRETKDKPTAETLLIETSPSHDSCEHFHLNNTD